jgi:hypothetical protein
MYTQCPRAFKSSKSTCNWLLTFKPFKSTWRCYILDTELNQWRYFKILFWDPLIHFCEFPSNKVNNPTAICPTATNPTIIHPTLARPTTVDNNAPSRTLGNQTFGCQTFGCWTFGCRTFGCRANSVGQIAVVQLCSRRVLSVLLVKINCGKKKQNILGHSCV